MLNEFAGTERVSGIIQIAVRAIDGQLLLPLLR